MDGKDEKFIESGKIRIQSEVRKCSQNATECIACALFDGNKTDRDLRCMSYFNSHQGMRHCDDVVEKKDE